MSPQPDSVDPVVPEDAGGLDPQALEQVIAAPGERFRHDYLEIRDLRVVFDGFVAVAGVDLTVTQGDLRFLIGPNGAGKTTIVDAITGLAPATGTVQFGRVDLLGKPSHRIVRAGVGRTFQTASVFDELTVAQRGYLASWGDGG